MSEAQLGVHLRIELSFLRVILSRHWCFLLAWKSDCWLAWATTCSLLFGSLHHQGFVNVGNHTTTSNRGFDQSVELLIATDCELQVAGCNTFDLQVFACIASELEHLSREVLKNRSGVYGWSCTYTAIWADSALQEPVDSSYRELRLCYYFFVFA